ncbi:transforming protein RhoA [Polychytrium aggregatum]|uniref:transforming protein RhoA n=1 Tax=Polychytrium aggregatum TaxID=110093 RepID=UPI0022FDB261|nr:transforming protein RhoA [Polychytrium aggregatum]KAI9205125.1 transforming protein RhoA [Polychytrium aggregatum]
MGVTSRKLVVVGDGNVGKTTLLTVFAYGRFPEHYIPTTFESYVAELSIDGQDIGLALWDTAGQPEYDRLRPLSYPYSDVALICYAVDSPESLENITSQWIGEVRQFCPDVPVILVACKVDLRNDPNTLRALAARNEHPVLAEEGQAVAAKIGAYCYSETSAKNLEGVREVFESASRAALQRNRSQAEPHKSKKCALL